MNAPAEEFTFAENLDRDESVEERAEVQTARQATLAAAEVMANMVVWL